MRLSMPHQCHRDAAHSSLAAIAGARRQRLSFRWRRGGTVVFRRFCAFVILLVAVGACTLENNPPQTAAATATAGQPAPLPKEIERDVGPAYPDPALQAFVDRVGQNVVAKAGLPGTYHFYVLDQPVANAHALGSGYVFVTRGLLALMADEAELAAAL